MTQLARPQEAKMPNVQKERAGTPFSFRPIQMVSDIVLPKLVKVWGEERSRVISRSLQFAWDIRLGSKAQVKMPAETKKGRPISFRPSTRDEEIIQDLSAWNDDADVSQVVNLALLAAYEHIK